MNSSVCPEVVYYPSGFTTPYHGAKRLNTTRGHNFISYDLITSFLAKGDVFVLRNETEVHVYPCGDHSTAVRLGSEMSRHWTAYMKNRDNVSNRHLLEEIHKLSAAVKVLNEKLDALAYAPGMPAVQEAATEYKALEKINF